MFELVRSQNTGNDRGLEMTFELKEKRETNNQERETRVVQHRDVIWTSGASGGSRDGRGQLDARRETMTRCIRCRFHFFQHSEKQERPMSAC